jgi:DNA primase
LSFTVDKMPNMTTKELIQEIPISSVFAKYLNLNYRGKNLEGICPFHDDTRPSLKVSDEKGFYKCFSCGAGGDVFDFVMNFKRISFPEAMREIAQDHQIFIDETHNPRQDPYSLLKKVEQLYIEASKDNVGFENFFHDRKISITTARELNLGFAPDQNIVSELVKKDANQFDLALELGLIKYATNGYEDNFKNRIIFPIFDESGKCVGFCGRAISDQRPKYLNSKESFLFKKNRLLYGLNFSKNIIQKESSVIVVEGFMDFVSLYEKGITNAVACMGTSISDFCIDRLNELACEIILGLDSDDAGIRSMERMNKEMLKKGIVPCAISYLPSKDADEFLRNEENGSSRLKSLMNSSKTFLDNDIGELLELNKGMSIEKKLKTLRTIFSKVSDLGHAIGATERILQASRELGLVTEDKLILNEYENYLDSSKNPM